MLKKKGKWMVWALIAAIAIGWFVWSYRDKLWKISRPYLDTAHYYRFMEKYDDFVGVKAADAASILAKYDLYLILDGNTARWGAETGALFFPVTNSRSSEECFIYGFDLDEEHVILRPREGMDTDTFFYYVKEDRFRRWN